VIYYHS
jgi:hypothetical protein